MSKSNIISIRVLGDIKDINRKMGQVTGQLNGFQKTSKKISGAVKGLFAGLVVGQAVQGIKDITQAASDAQQSLGATETVFGKYANTVIADSKRAATAIGVSANEYRELSNVTGALLNGAGMPLKKVAGLTDDLNKRAADMAATFGGTTREAVESISSLMKGEADPIEKYGVSIKQSDVNARLAAKGQDKLTGAAKKQAEMQARLDLLMKKTNKTQGAFKRETNTLAHQQQVLKARWDNLKASLGTKLLPAMTTAAAFISNNLGPAFEKIGTVITTQVWPALQNFGGWFKEHQAILLPIAAGITAMATAWGIYKGVMVVIGGVVKAYTAVQAALNVVMAMNPIGLVVLAVIGLTAAFVVAWKRSATFRNTLIGTWEAIKSGAKAIFGAVKNFIVNTWKSISSTTSSVWNSIKGAVTGAFNAVVGAVRGGVSKVIDIVNGLRSKVVGAVSGAANWLKSAGADIVRGLGSGIDSMRQWVRDKVNALSGWIPKWVKKKLGIASPSKVMRKLARWIPAGIAKGIEDGKSGVEKATKMVTDTITKGLGKKAPAALKAWTAASSKDRSNANALARQYEKVSARLKDAKDKYAELKKAATDYANGIRDNAKGYASLGNLNSAFNADAMAEQMRARLGKIKQYNTLMADLMKKGLNKDMVGELANAGVEGGLAYAQAIAAGGPAAIKEFNSLQSQVNSAATKMGKTTSNYMNKAGVDAAAGVVKGLEKSLKKIEKATEKVAKSMVKSLKKALGIKSPSRVFKGLATHTIEGLEIGLQDTRGVTQRVQRLASAMTDAYSPDLRANAQVAGAGGNVYITVNAPVGADMASAGREIERALTAYHRKTGRA